MRFPWGKELRLKGLLFGVVMVMGSSEVEGTVGNISEGVHHLDQDLYVLSTVNFERGRGAFMRPVVGEFRSDDRSLSRRSPTSRT